MTLFEQLGIKEVTDLTLYSIHNKEDSGDAYCVPALYLDTLKISTVEKTAQSTWASGGKDNSDLICWDFGKKISVRLEDALCSPASLDLCWGGIFGSKWENGEIDFNTNLKDSVKSISKFEKLFYPKDNKDKITINMMLPPNEKENYEDFSKTVDFLNQLLICGQFINSNRVYNWKMDISAQERSIFIVPDRFFDINGKSYGIIRKVFNKVVSFDDDLFVKEVVYELDEIDNFDNMNNVKYLKIKIDNDNNYYSYIGQDLDTFEITDKINTFQFKDIDMWNSFSGLNNLIYFLITKYEKYIKTDSDLFLWAYVYPKTLKPYDDDYWFSQGERFQKYSLSLSKNGLAAKSIIIRSGQYPGLFMAKGETLIRDKDGIDQKVQIIFPLCKIKSDNDISISADGEPSVFNIDMELVKPKNGILMQIVFYDENKKELLFDGSLKINNMEG